MTSASTIARRFLGGIGLLFCLFAVLQAALAFGDASWSAFFGPPRWVLAVIHEGGITLAALGAAAITGSLAIALCCLSGGGLIAPFRGQRPCLYAIGALLALWGVRVLELVALRLRHGVAVRWPLYVIRGAPLVIGLALLWAVWVLRDTPAPTAPKDGM